MLEDWDPALCGEPQSLVRPVLIPRTGVCQCPRPVASKGEVSSLDSLTFIYSLWKGTVSMCLLKPLADVSAPVSGKDMTLCDQLSLQFVVLPMPAFCGFQWRRRRDRSSWNMPAYWPESVCRSQGNLSSNLWSSNVVPSCGSTLAESPNDTRFALGQLGRDLFDDAYCHRKGDGNRQPHRSWISWCRVASTTALV
jgi:hypothetical protein